MVLTSAGSAGQQMVPGARKIRCVTTRPVQSPPPSLSSGSTLSAAPRAIASFGMPNTTDVVSSCATVSAPICFISSSPCAPSSPMPVMMMPTPLAPTLCAADRNSTSTDGRWRDTSGPSLP